MKDLLKGSLKERAKIMKKITINTDEEFLLCVKHNGVLITEKIVRVSSMEYKISSRSKNESYVKVELSCYPNQYDSPIVDFIINQL